MAGDHYNAAKSFKKAIGIDPSNFEAHNSLGVSLYQIGEKDRAMDEWQFVLSLSPGNAAAAANLAMTRHPENADEIVAATKSAKRPTIEKGSGSVAAYFINGKKTYKSTDFEKAADIFSQILETKPDSKFSYYFLGMSQAYLGRSQEAMKNLREYLILETYPPEGAAEYERAMSTFKMLKAGKAIKPGPGDKDLQAAKAFDAGKQMLVNKDYIKAVQFLRQAVAIKPDSYQVNYLLGLSYKGIGDRERATFHLTKCLLAGPESRSKDEAMKIASLLRELTK
jgi:Flp pilus assembly protein TadD